MKPISLESFSNSNEYVYYFIYRIAIIQNILDSLTKDDVININKTIRKLRKTETIFSMIRPGSRSYPDTFDWRIDKDFVTRLLFCRSTFHSTMIAALTKIRDSKFDPNYATSIENIINNAHKSPEAVIYRIAVNPEFSEYKEDMYSNFQEKQLSLIKKIDIALKENHISLPLAISKPEQLQVTGLQLLQSLKDHAAFPEDLKKPLEDLQHQLGSQINQIKVDDSLKTYDHGESTSHTENAYTESIKENSMTSANTKKYIGYIRLQKSFFNFHPVAEIDHGNVKQIASDILQQTFPRFGAFSLVRDYFKDNATRNLIENYFYCIDLYPGDLANNTTVDGTVRDDYKYKLVDFHELVRNQRFKAIEAEQSYLVVYPISENPNLQSSIYVSFNRDGDVDPIASYTRIPVVLALNGQYIGPTPLLRDSNDQVYVNFRSGTNDGVVNCFTGDAIHQAIYPYAIYANEEAKHCARDVLDTTHPCVSKAFFDLLDDATLLKRMAEQSKLIDKKNLAQFREFLEKCTLDANLLGPNEQIQNERKDRLAHYLKHLQLNEENLDTFATVVTNSMAMAKNDQSGFFDELVKRIVETPDALERIKEYKLVHDQIEVLQQQRDHEEKELEKIRASIEKFNNEKDNLQKQKLEGELANIKDEIEKQKAKRDEALKAMGLINNLQVVRNEVNALEDKNRTLRQNISYLEDEAAGIEHDLINKVNSRTIKDLAFNPALAHKLNEAAAQWLKTDDADKLKKKVDAVSNLNGYCFISSENSGGIQLVDYLYNQTKRFRAYDRNTILNLYICLSQNLLTVFSGRPGCGKTSICHIMAHVLGSLSFETEAKVDNVNRFLPVSVERGWTSKRDFLGYFNPLTKRFETPDPRRYLAIQTLDEENKNHLNKFPYIVLLDESNLSPMEYYWADFMNMGQDVGCMNTLSLGDGTLYKVPSTLRFLATINNDQTTENLSPRLIDRACVITLPDTSWETFGQTVEIPKVDDEQIRIVDWKTLQDVFSYNACAKEIEKYEEKITGILTSIYKSMTELGLHPSPRTQKAILAYVAAGTKWFEKEADQAFTFNTAIDYAVSQKLLPSISLVGDKYTPRLEELQNILETNDLTRSAMMLQTMIERGNASMNLYSFF